MSRRRKEGEEVWPPPSSAGYIGGGEREQGDGKARESQFGGAKLGSQDNSGKASYFSSRHFWRSRSNKRERKEVVRPKMVRKANTELLPTQCPTCTAWYRDGLLASSPHSGKRDDYWGQLQVIQHKPLTLTLEARSIEFTPESQSSTQSSSDPLTHIKIRPLPLPPTCKD